jgi:hypothetical protein
MSKDNVNQPDHYTQGGVECIDAITAATVNKTGIEAVCVANVIKYLWRYELKNGLEDVKKAQWYLNRPRRSANAPYCPCRNTGFHGQRVPSHRRDGADYPRPGCAS